MSKLQAKKTRTRLAPDVRRAQLLDCAKVIIEQEGLTSLTMELVAERAEVSNPLIYKYFGSRLALLQELYRRELKRYHRQVQEQSEQTETLEDVIRLAVTLNFKEHAQGNILEILRSQVDVRAPSANAEARAQRNSGRVLREALLSSYDISERDALRIIILASGASQTAAREFKRFGGSRDDAIERTIAFIFGGIHALVGTAK
nr:TetR/AcrR family transcriptional regulator [Hyphomonas sp. Mor2]